MYDVTHKNFNLKKAERISCSFCCIIKIKNASTFNLVRLEWKRQLSEVQLQSCVTRMSTERKFREVLPSLIFYIFYVSMTFKPSHQPLESFLSLSFGACSKVDYQSLLFYKQFSDIKLTIEKWCETRAINGIDFMYSIVVLSVVFRGVAGRRTIVWGKAVVVVNKRKVNHDVSIIILTFRLLYIQFSHLSSSWLH